MYLTRAFLLLAAVSAEALKTAHQAPSATAGDLAVSRISGKLLENFGQSDLDFEHWIDLMVEQGHLFRPKVTDSSVMLARDGEGNGWKVTLKNVACSTVTGSKDLLERAEGHFCDDFIKNAGNMMAREMELDVTRLLCDNGTFCKLGVKSVFDFFHLFPTADDIANVCHDMFNAIQDVCPDGGGVADTEVTTSNGAAELGQLEFSYTLGNGECQQDPTHQCFDRDIQ
ncbi:hypothetical protein FZEAL_3493 [Fusarium zealandicum]|uniref:Uncharacterized protein n=1 Tax=Fusarium zealandicum TaxID=1053134 RepID=A0A8H4UP71_9HYPO|nr:hypothetical protein FZEAL_3493 [Fusarium zealandicum]